MTEQFDKQRRELDSYNVFYSAIKGIDADEGLLDLGFRVVGNFMQVPGRDGNLSDPDIVLYNNETLLLVEVKSGNSVESRDEKQMQRAGELSVEDGREFLKDTDFDDPVLDHTELTDIQPVIVYDFETILSCKQSASCKDRLTSMGENGGVLSQQKGGELELVQGTVSDNALESLLESGIALPKFPDTTLYLTENTNREILAYSICFDLVRPQFNTQNRVEVEPEDVYNRYRGREIKRRKLVDALQFLTQINACSNPSGQLYIFHRSDIGTIMSVTEKLEEKRVKDWLAGETSGQSSLDEWEDEDKDNSETE